jgi:hypothetical protein
MEIRDAVEADAEALADLGDAPSDVMRNLVHDRSVRVAERTDENDDGTRTVVGFVSFDARDETVYVTQVAGTSTACERLLEEPVRFATGEGMSVELLVETDDSVVRDAALSTGFVEAGSGPQFDGQRTVRYRLDPA